MRALRQPATSIGSARASAISAICVSRTSRREGNIGYRCAAEPVANYVAKGGKAEDTVGRKCLCNALLANIGYHADAQRQK